MAQDLLLDAEARGGESASASELRLADEDARPLRPEQGLRGRSLTDRKYSAADRCALFGVAIIACIQVVLSLRLYNTTFNDEALYLWAGHIELMRWLHGAVMSGATTRSFDSYFAGDPVLYPPLGAAAAGVSLLLARLLSAAFMVIATAGVFGFGRRVFGLGTGLVATGVFACAPSVLFLSHFATIVPLATAALVASMWLTARGRDCRGMAARYVLATLAGVAAGLAGGAAYTCLLFAPILLAVAFMVFSRGRGWRAGAAGSSFFAIGGGAVVAALYASNPAMGTGIAHTLAMTGVTTSVPVSTVLSHTARLIAPQAVLAVVGCAMLLWTPEGRKDAGRLLAVTLLCGGALVTAVQAGTSSDANLLQQQAFSLPFLAILGGSAAVVIVRHLRGRGVFVAAFAILGVLLFAGATFSTAFRWSNEQRVIHLLRGRVQAGRHVYLADYDHIFEYYFENKTRPDEWTSTNYFSYRFDGRREVGAAAYASAVRQGYFSMVVLSSTGPNRSLDAALERDLEASRRYVLWRQLRDSRHSDEVWSIFVLARRSP